MIYKVIMLSLLIFFYFLYFAKQLSLKRHGINTNRLGKGIKPKRTRLIECCLLVVTYTTALVQFLSVFWSANMGKMEFSVPIRVIGILIVLCGVVFFLLAITTMRDNWRAGIDKTQKIKIVSEGIYRYSRNPAFVGFDLIYIGTVLTFPSILMSIFAVLTVVILHLQILEEEKYLSSEFGQDYLEYKNQTVRYFFF